MTISRNYQALSRYRIMGDALDRLDYKHTETILTVRDLTTRYSRLLMSPLLVSIENVVYTVLYRVCVPIPWIGMVKVNFKNARISEWPN